MREILSNWRLPRQLTLLLIGIINALAFAFIPPSLPLITRIINPMARGEAGFSFWLVFTVITIGSACIVNYYFIKGVLISHKNRKNYHAMLPFLGWLMTTLLLLIPQSFWRSYLRLAVPMTSTLFADFTQMPYIILLLFSGVVEILAPSIAYQSCCKR